MRSLTATGMLVVLWSGLLATAQAQTTLPVASPETTGLRPEVLAQIDAARGDEKHRAFAAAL